MPGPFLTILNGLKAGPTSHAVVVRREAAVGGPFFHFQLLRKAKRVLLGKVTRSFPKILTSKEVDGSSNQTVESDAPRLRQALRNCQSRLHDAGADAKVFSS